jgi:poly(A) polymerase
LLTALLVSRAPQAGLALLDAAGFIDNYWPTLAALKNVHHSKDFHPEGGGWEHTLETLRYRSTPDLTLSLALLLHDVGKPLTQSTGRTRFAAHAERGERVARRFLTQLGFEDALANNVCFRVRHHMLPAAIPRLPLETTAPVMASPLFPQLLELYRCDESSSFKPLDAYHRAADFYRRFAAHR